MIRNNLEEYNPYEKIFKGRLDPKMVERVSIFLYLYKKRTKTNNNRNRKEKEKENRKKKVEGIVIHFKFGKFKKS